MRIKARRILHAEYDTAWRCDHCGDGPFDMDAPRHPVGRYDLCEDCAVERSIHDGEVEERKRRRDQAIKEFARRWDYDNPEPMWIWLALE